MKTTKCTEEREAFLLFIKDKINPERTKRWQREITEREAIQLYMAFKEFQRAWKHREK
jgi:hypothetical protein